jgi:hypothetical protein
VNWELRGCSDGRHLPGRREICQDSWPICELHILLLFENKNERYHNYTAIPVLSSLKELNITFSHSSFSVKRRILKANSCPAGREAPFHGNCTTVIVFTRANYWTLFLAKILLTGSNALYF